MTGKIVFVEEEITRSPEVARQPDTNATYFTLFPSVSPN